MAAAVTRRSLIGGAFAIAAATHLPEAHAAPRPLSFHGTRQPGIALRRQRRLAAAGFAVTGTSRADVRDLMRTWSESAAALMAAGDRLTVTFGFGASLFVADGADRFGLAAARPAGLVDLPSLRTDQLEPGRSDGDLHVQVCADAAGAARAAMARLERDAAGVAHPLWRQTGAHGRERPGHTPRNLQGFKDGTNNLRSDDAAALRRHVWVPRTGSEVAWMRGGTFLLMRRIRMLLGAWERAGVHRQELAVGRHKRSGAPLGRRHEHDRVDLGRLDAHGRRAIPLGAHIRHASPEENGGARLLRRGYEFDDGPHDRGLFFLAFQRDPRTHGLPMLEQLATYDRLNPYTRHVGRGLYACPPGAAAGSYVGAALLG